MGCAPLWRPSPGQCWHGGSKWTVFYFPARQLNHKKTSRYPSLMNSASYDNSPKPVSAGALYGRLVREAVAPYAISFAAATACMVAIAVSTAGLAWLMDPVVNRVFVEQRADLLWPVGLAVFATFAVKGAATYGQSVIMARAGQTILTDLQNRLFRHLLTMDLGFFAANRTGALISRLTTDINAMRIAVSTALTALGRETLSIILLVGVMFYQDWLLATIAFVAFPAAVFPVASLG
ncbi:MAG: ABC transporter transmembrane domain-containing protein, partial [Rhodospirillaceae bacterium]